MSDKATKGGFDALLEEIGGLAKALPAEESGEDKVEAAAAEAEEDPEEDEGEKPMAKSYVLKGADGEEVEAIDGTELVKSLIARVEASDDKVLTAVTGLVGIVKGQAEMIKSQGAAIIALQGSSKPRKTVLTVTERPAPKAEEMIKSDQTGGVSGEEFMAKAMTAQVGGKITSRQVAVAEQYINAGQSPPADIVRAVLS